MARGTRGYDWDAIVVGAGIGGLTTAAYLQTNGLRTLVLEQYDVGLHYVGDCEPGGQIPMLLRGVGLEGRIDWLEMDPDGFDTIVLPERTFRVPRGWDRYTERLVATFPEDADGIRRCVEVLRDVARQALEARTAERLRSCLRWPFEQPQLVRWGLRPLSRLFDACRLSPGARAVLGGQTGLYGAPAERAAIVIHAVVMDHYVGGGAFYPRGGGQVPAALLVAAIQAHGGEVRTRARVERIDVRRGGVEGVTLRGGETLTAPVVVSDADVKRTFLELVGPEHVPGRVLRRVRRYRMAPPIFSVYLGLDIDLCERIPNSNYWFFPTSDISAPYAWTADQPVPERIFTYVVSSSRKDPHTPALAPPGHSSVQLMTFVPPDYSFWHAERGPAAGERYSRNPAYLDAKRRVEEALIRSTAEAVPELSDIEDHIVWREAASPLTQERYTLSSGGSCYGLELSPDQSGPRRPFPRTAIRGLYLAGAGQFYGHGVFGTMCGGAAAAGAVLGRDVRREVLRGAVFGDPRRITAGGPDWDPFFAARRLSKKQRPRVRTPLGT